ncbi:response regulator [Myxococcota bacterium]|nr:response regulator [Myxococcota bacterium]
MAALARPRVLCVDDEPLVLEGLAASLRRKFDVRTATGGSAALELIEDEPAFDVVVSDFAMPEMNGAQFLELARLAAPSAVRVLLTGHASVEHAIAAVNAGHIFRFLTKPCAPADLARAIDDAVEHGRLVALDRSLSERRLEAMSGHLLVAERFSSAGAVAVSVADELEHVRAALGAVIDRLHAHTSAAIPAELPELDVLDAQRRALDPLPARLRRSSQATEDLSSPTDLVATIAGEVRALAELGQLAEVAIKTTLPPGPLWVAMPKARAAQLVSNLLRNALDAVATCERRAVDVVVTQASRTAVLAVTDSGVGVPAAQLPMIFEPYFTTKPGHSGLGLFAVREILRACGGSVDVVSEPGRGTTFEVHAPITAESRPPRVPS